MITELTLFASTPYAQAPISSVYIGGGTPSLLSHTDIQRILTALADNYSLAPNATVSLECNPENNNKQYLVELKRLGINRLSIGTQSFSDSVLQQLGRLHTARDNRQIINHAVQAGFTDLNLDLIYGMPFQDETAWLSSIQETVSYAPTHISAYVLSLEPGTKFWATDTYRDWINANDLKISGMFDQLRQILEANRYRIYEVSNFSLPGHKSIQNLLYWNNADYFGFGPGAHSKIGNTRKETTRNYRLWLKHLSTQKAPPHHVETITPEKRRDETLLIGLRTVEGIPLNTIPDALGVDIKTFWGLPTVRRLKSLKAVAEDLEHFRLLPKTFMLADKIAVDISTEIDRL